MNERRLFLEYLGDEGAAAATIVAYRAVLRGFEPLDQVLGLSPMALRDMIERTAKAYRWGPATKTKALMALRTFYQWAMFRGLATSNPAAAIRPAKAKKKIRKVPTKDEILSAWNRCRGPHGWEGLSRDALVDPVAVGLLYFAALRRGEALGLREEDVNLGLNLLTVRRSDPGSNATKGGRDRTVPVAAELREVLLAFRVGPVITDIQTRVSVGDGYVLGGPTPLTRDDIAGAVAAFSRFLPFRLTPHGLRHARATHLAEAGMEPFALQQFLGHATIGSTQEYVHVSGRYVSDELARVGG